MSFASLPLALLILTATVLSGRPEATWSGGELSLRDAVPTVSRGIWISRAELASLPMNGTAWSRLKRAADGSLGVPAIRDQESNHDVLTLGVSLVFARTGSSSYRTKATSAIKSAMGTERDGTSLALARNLVSYVIAADLVGLSGSDEDSFRSWLRSVLTATMADGRSLRSTHESRPNNWGTHAGASRAAVAVYLGDTAELAETAKVFRGWLGDRATYAGFRYGDLSWQCNRSAPVGINVLGCTRDGHSIDGVLPDDQRRSGGFAWPPPQENYVWEALQGAIVQAEILSRAGHDSWRWQSGAIYRAFHWLYEEANNPAAGDDEWQVHLLNWRYGSSFPSTVPARTGKNMGWTDWTHGPGRSQL